jgi:hypothetical protein
MPYEYRVEDIGSHVSAEWLSTKLNETAPSGWELVAATDAPGGMLRLIYRREINRALVLEAVLPPP